ncbi:RNA recognition motif containing protein [Nitzschia inconspicua]|uniref:RNA recognition motif containing protein n=1 Tax=Nitzschia inconspicua TaxID=303405 RepID=A0A9K3PLQ1_9STRA|nr:RNA recognition motif containing protein [Nitzschia inconspicua]
MLSLPPTLLVAAILLKIFNACNGFLVPPPTVVNCCPTGSFHDTTTSLFVQNEPDITVLQDDWYDDNDNDNDYDDIKTPYVPPDFSVIDNDDDDGGYNPSSKVSPPEIRIERDLRDRRNYINDDDDYAEASSKSRPRNVRIKKRETPSMAGTSWMEKNAKFSNEEDSTIEDPYGSNWNRGDQSPRRSRGGDDRFKRSIADTKTFRQDFRKTRVFVQGIPEGVSWQDLKDHFRVAGNVVFASVSVDVNTGITKGHGIVQFETTDMAQRAIDIMADYPLNGRNLFVREDVQENKNPNARLSNDQPRGPTPPTKWKCANEDNAVFMSEEELLSVRNLIKARDDARRRKKYDVSDRIRDELKDSHGVFIDDRLKMWWTSMDGNKVPKSIHDIKGDGRWKLKPWRQIPTTPENDACVNADLVEGLLKQRDVARREKDFSTADALLEEARTSPDGDLTLRIHDESRTWRVWTDDRPSFGNDSYQERRQMPSDPEDARKSAARECIEITKEHAPEKIDEIIDVLKRFKGREFQVLKRLKQQYL